MPDNEKKIEVLEAIFPAVSGSAFTNAREHVLASGQSIFETSNGTIYEVFPDGRRIAVKQIQPPVQVGNRTFIIQ